MCKKRESQADAFKLRCQNSGTKSDTGLGGSEVVGETSGWSRYGQGSYISYISVLGIGVTWHSHMSNASKGCHEISRVVSSYAKPGRRCINAMWQYQIGCLHSCDIHHSVFSLKKWPSATPSKHREGLNPQRGGGLHENGSLQPETFDVIDHCLFPKTAPNTFLKESQLQLAS